MSLGRLKKLGRDLTLKFRVLLREGGIGYAQSNLERKRDEWGGRKGKGGLCKAPLLDWRQLCQKLTDVFSTRCQEGSYTGARFAGGGLLETTRRGEKDRQLRVAPEGEILS